MKGKHLKKQPECSSTGQSFLIYVPSGAAPDVRRRTHPPKETVLWGERSRGERWPPIFNSPLSFRRYDSSRCRSKLTPFFSAANRSRVVLRGTIMGRRWQLNAFFVVSSRAFLHFYFLSPNHIWLLHLIKKSSSCLQIGPSSRRSARSDSSLFAERPHPSVFCLRNYCQPPAARSRRDFCIPDRNLEHLYKWAAAPRRKST